MAGLGGRKSKVAPELFQTTEPTAEPYRAGPVEEHTLMIGDPESPTMQQAATSVTEPKERITFAVDKKIAKRLGLYCLEKGIKNRTALLSDCVEQFLTREGF